MTILVFLGCLPLLTVASLVAARGRWFAPWIDLAAATATMAALLWLPWGDGTPSVVVRTDTLTVWFACLIALVSIVDHVRGLGRSGRPTARRIADEIVLMGGIWACLITDASIGWLAIAVACLAREYPLLSRRRDRLPTVGAGLGIALFGLSMTIGGFGMPLLAMGCVVLGFAAVVSLVPVLAAPVLLLVLRLHWANGAALEPLLYAGVVIVALCAAWFATRPAESAGIALPVLTQCGVVLFAFGLGSAPAIFAGIFHLTLVTLSAASAAIAGTDAGVRRLGRLSAMAIPPFAAFPSLVLVLNYGFERAPFLSVLLALALATQAVLLVRQLQVRPPPNLSLGLLPLALTTLLGWCLPDLVSDLLMAGLVNAR